MKKLEKLLILDALLTEIFHNHKIFLENKTVYSLEMGHGKAVIVLYNKLVKKFFRKSPVIQAYKLEHCRKTIKGIKSEQQKFLEENDPVLKEIRTLDWEYEIEDFVVEFILENGSVKYDLRNRRLIYEGENNNPAFTYNDLLELLKSF